jgi:hypothetical protein
MIKVFHNKPLVRTQFLLITGILSVSAYHSDSFLINLSYPDESHQSWSDSTGLLYPFYRFCSATTFLGTYTALSLPFLLCHYIFGHVYCPFFTVFALLPHFRACILPFLYRFYSDLPFFVRICLPFGLVSHPFQLSCPNQPLIRTRFPLNSPNLSKLVLSG